MTLYQNPHNQNQNRCRDREIKIVHQRHFRTSMYIIVHYIICIQKFLKHSQIDFSSDHAAPVISGVQIELMQKCCVGHKVLFEQ